MKHKNLIWIIGLIAIALLPLIFAAAGDEIASSISFGTIWGDGTQGYNIIISDNSENFRVGNVQTSRLIFTSAEAYPGFYYWKGSQIRQFSSDYDFISPIINNAIYDLKYFAVSPIDLENVDVEQGVFMLSTSDMANAMKIGVISTASVILVEDGSKIFANTQNGYVQVELPATISFQKKAEVNAEAEAASTAASEIVVGKDEAEGCKDMDSKQTEPEIYVPSYATYVHQNLDYQLVSITIADFCAEQQTNDPLITRTRLYEAKCENGIPTYEIVDCPNGNCRNGACVSSDSGDKFCEDTDKLDYDENEADNNKINEAFRRTFGIKGNTVGYYAATTGGREFGLWEDYCKNSKELVEYFCDQKTARFRSIICPEGCSNGACLKLPYCFETDGGNVKEVKGKLKALDAQGNFHNKIDRCNSDGTVLEYYCNENNMTKGYSTENVNCDEGQTCKGNSGKCLSVDAQPDEEEVETETNSCTRCATNPYHILQWNAENCKLHAQMPPSTRYRCPQGQFCSTGTGTCINEIFNPDTASFEPIWEGIERRKLWVEWIREMLNISFDFESEMDAAATEFEGVAIIVEAELADARDALIRLPAR